MSEFSNRLGLVRKKLKFTQRDFAKDLGVSHATYSSWELGKTAPVAGVLEYLCTLGVNGHWLLTGAGTMMWNDRTPSEAVFSGTEPKDYQTSESKYGNSYVRDRYAPQSQADLIKEAQLREMEEMGLGDLFIMSRRGTQGVQWQLLLILARASDGLDLRSLQRGLEKEHRKNIDPLDLLADLQLLQQKDLIFIEEDRWRVRDVAKITFLLQADRLQAAKAIIAGLGKYVLPALNREDDSGYIGMANLKVTSSKASLASLKSKLRAFFEENHDEDGVEFLLYVAAASRSKL